jgi:hypothetical protein
MSNIKSFRQFLEATVKEITVTFGRFNPPTIGHEKLLNTVASEAAGGTYKIYASQSNDENKNPLQYSEKIKLMRSMFPKYGRNIIEDKSIKTIFDVAEKAYKDGFTRFILVVGEDRVEEFSKLLKKYQGQQLKNGGFYDFPGGIEVVSAGDRDPDSDDVEGMSASKMRQAVRDGDLKEFSKGLPRGFEDGISIFNLLRKRMGLKETTNFREHVQLSPLSSIREAYVRGEIFRVGESCRLKGGEVVQIIKRGPNFLVTEGEKKHWLQDVEPISEGWAHDEHKRLGGKNVLFIDDHGEQDILDKRKHIQSGLESLSNQPKEAFKVFRNLNGDTAFQQIKWLPHFYLV